MFPSKVLTTQPDAEQHQERRVIPGPLVFSLFAVVEVAVHFLWGCEQIEHLPYGELEVHLSEMQEPPQVLVAFGTGRVPCRIPCAEAAVLVDLWRACRQHTVGMREKFGYDKHSGLQIIGYL